MGPARLLQTAGMAADEVRVLVVDDQRPFRAAAAAVLRRTPGFALVGEADSGEAALQVVTNLAPDLVLMDITMPGIGGLEATRRLTALRPATRVVLCSTYRREDLPAEVGTSGAAAYLHKQELRPELLVRLWQEASPGAPLTPPAAPLPG